MGRTSHTQGNLPDLALPYLTLFHLADGAYLAQSAVLFSMRALSWNLNALTAVPVSVGGSFVLGAAVHYLVQRPLSPKLRICVDRCFGAHAQEPPPAAAAIATPSAV